MAKMDLKTPRRAIRVPHGPAGVWWSPRIVMRQWRGFEAVFRGVILTLVASMSAFSRMRWFSLDYSALCLVFGCIADAAVS